MQANSVERNLDKIVELLTSEARSRSFTDAKEFEQRVREAAAEFFGKNAIDYDPAAQAFPDIEIKGTGAGIEVKFTTADSWRSVANSVLETNRIQNVKKVYVVFGKMGGVPEVRWGEYEKCVMHVRTSHVPRFEVDIEAEESLFTQMGVTYDKFRTSEMHEKMEYIRKYARGRLRPGERLWWLEDSPNEVHSLPIQARLYTKLPLDEKTKLRAEAVLLCPQIVASGRSRNKYDDVVLYLLTYHGVLCHQARDLFSAGSVANPDNDDEGGLYIERAIKLIEGEMIAAAYRMDDALFQEYWGKSVPPNRRIKEWLARADLAAQGWTPSQSLFLSQRI
ncbi:hypothetical protein [Dyella sp. RRB7]|uniref:hypothetical protein n=1 Tax=Dyella sp. RRB7 TaxID=2919502 RepID=UPI001FAAE668|nr:hypothetical protein [Dyella sp. RRB7]